MPEIITKYPKVVLEVLESGHISCGKDTKPAILTSCPKAQFCSLPGGELCIYDVKDTLGTRQITNTDLLLLPGLWVPIGLIAVMVFLAGLFAGTKLR